MTKKKTFTVDEENRIKLLIGREFKRLIEHIARCIETAVRADVSLAIRDMRKMMQEDMDEPRMSDVEQEKPIDIFVSKKLGKVLDKKELMAIMKKWLDEVDF